MRSKRFIQLSENDLKNQIANKPLFSQSPGHLNSAGMLRIAKKELLLKCRPPYDSCQSSVALIFAVDGLSGLYEALAQGALERVPL